MVKFLKVIINMSFCLTAFLDSNLFACCWGSESKEEERQPLKHSTKAVITEPGKSKFDNPAFENSTSIGSGGGSLNVSLLSNSVLDYGEEVKKFEGTSLNVLAYLGSYTGGKEEIKIEESPRKWILTYKDRQLVLIYVTALEHPALQDTYTSKMKMAPKLPSFMDPVIKAYLEENHSDLFEMIVGALVYAHGKSERCMYSSKGAKGNNAIIFASPHDKKIVPPGYAGLVLLTGPQSSSNLSQKRDIL